jgi:hypothetical protein
MNSSNDSQERQPHFSLLIPGRLPSWNALLGLGHWQRAKLKNQIQESFLSALRAAAADCLTRTTSQRSSMSIAAATLDSYRAMRLSARVLKSAKKKLEKQSAKKRALKS